MAKRPSQPPYGRQQPDPRQSNQKDTELPGVLGFMARNTQLLGWLNLLAAIVLVYFAISGFLQGLVFLPFGFGLMALYFFYAYVRVGLKVNLGKLATPLNLVMLLSALVCLVIGMTNNS